ncbi:MAG: PIG-L deacetylase family protein [Actinomycetales bacterium]
MPGTLVSFHAHPDDEALLVSGTLARAAAEGHRVVVVVATAGEAGLTDDTHSADGRLGERRMAELRRSADLLGVARVECLGYADSGLPPHEVRQDPPGTTCFVRADREQAAERLAAILREERADVLTTYDANGGYGHPDHVQVHHVGARAGELAGTPAVLQATVPRDLMLRGVRLAAKVHRFPPEFDVTTFERAFTPAVQITHRIDVRPFADAKRASMRAHASQTAGGQGDRTLAAFVRMPRPLFRRVFGREWFVQAGLSAEQRAHGPYGDVFGTVPAMRDGDRG